MTTKLLLSGADTRMRSLLELSQLTFRRFGREHGYDVETQHWDGVLGPRRARWRKVELLRAAVQAYDIVVWIDADAVICRYDRDITADFVEDCFQGLVLEHCWDRFNPNTGVWVLRRDPRSIDLLEELLAAGPPEHSWSDQAAVCLALGWHLGDFHGHGAKPMRGSRFLTGTAWLSPEWNPTGLAADCPGARVHHFAGQGLALRRQRVSQLVTALRAAGRLE